MDQFRPFQKCLSFTATLLNLFAGIPYLYHVFFGRNPPCFSEVKCLWDYSPWCHYCYFHKCWYAMGEKYVFYQQGFAYVCDHCHYDSFGCLSACARYHSIVFDLSAGDLIERNASNQLWLKISFIGFIQIVSAEWQCNTL